jgi:hypothetical protein
MVRADRTPLAELGHVLDQDVVDVELLRPLQDVPRRRARLVVDRAAAARRAVVRALRPAISRSRRPVFLKVLPGHRVDEHLGLRVDALDGLAEVHVSGWFGGASRWRPASG